MYSFFSQTFVEHIQLRRTQLRHSQLQKRAKDHGTLSKICACFTLLVVSFLHSGCAKMVFHNQPPEQSGHQAYLATPSPYTETDQHIAKSLSSNHIFQDMKPEQHDIKSGESLMIYFGGETSTIELSDWCGKRSWLRFKTKQTAVDVFVRWLASPFYATNSIELECEPKHKAAVAQAANMP